MMTPKVLHLSRSSFLKMSAYVNSTINNSNNNPAQLRYCYQQTIDGATTDCGQPNNLADAILLMLINDKAECPWNIQWLDPEYDDSPVLLLQTRR